jgi:hypothetical protein
VVIWGTAAGVVSQQNKTHFLTTAGTFQPLTVETPWIKLAGLQGYQRVWNVILYANNVTYHDLTISIATDYASSYEESVTYTAAQLNALPLEQIPIIPKNQKCEAIRVKIQDATPSGGLSVGTGQGPVLVGLAFEYQQKSGAMRLPRL